MVDRRNKNRSGIGSFCGEDSTWVILATGESLSVPDVEYVRGKAKTAAVSDAFRLAPWADALVSNDRKWWEANVDANDFKGLKFCSQDIRGANQFRSHIHLGRNSGLMAMIVAKTLGAKRLILLGFDMHGTHFFGKHPEPLKNTTEKIFATHIRQFDGFSGCEVINCTPDSSLTRFPFKPLREVL